jgi:hypothetical protein
MWKKSYEQEQLKIFWVGLMDGDGSIQVNHWRQKNLVYRLIIKLKYTIANESMLKQIAMAVGGTVRKAKRDEREEILWAMNDKKAIVSIVEVFRQYPPKTTRLQLQLKFLQECLEHQSVAKYLEEREHKYACPGGEQIQTLCEVKIPMGSLGQAVQYPSGKGEIENPLYYDIWLSGFVEAKGCFLQRVPQNIVGFSISQKNDRHLIETIRTRLGIESSQNYVQKKAQWTIETTTASTVASIIKHFEEVPLLGEKRISMEIAKERLYNKIQMSNRGPPYPKKNNSIGLNSLKIK